MTLETLEDYRHAIAQAEREMLEAKRRLVELRQRAPREPFEDHPLTAPDGTAIRLSDLFGASDDLLVIHNMGRGCSYCTLWADGFNSLVNHLESRTAFVVVSADAPEVMREFAASRGWRFRMASAKGSTFTRASGFCDPDKGSPWPGASSFRRQPDGSIVRVSKAEVEPYDDFCSVWHLFELLEGGIQGWEPRLRYA